MIQFYKPNAKVAGTACSFWVSPGGDAIVSMIKQASWDDSKKKGSFAENKKNPQKNVFAKLSETEVAGFIDCLESNREFSSFHKSQNQVLQIRFGPYFEKEEKDVVIGNFWGEVSVKNEKAILAGHANGTVSKKERVQKGFSFSINKQGKEDSTDKSSFLIGFSFPEGRLLKHKLIDLLSSMKVNAQEESGDGNQDEPKSKPEPKEKKESGAGDTDAGNDDW